MTLWPYIDPDKREKTHRHVRHTIQDTPQSLLFFFIKKPSYMGWWYWSVTTMVLSAYSYLHRWNPRGKTLCRARLACLESKTHFCIGSNSRALLFHNQVAYFSEQNNHNHPYLYTSLLLHFFRLHGCCLSTFRSFNVQDIVTSNQHLSQKACKLIINEFFRSIQ